MAIDKYDYESKEFEAWVEGYSRDGFNEHQIAEALGLTASHFSELKVKYPNITEAIKRGRKPLDILVENSLYKRAVGLKVKTTVLKGIRNKETGELIADLEEMQVTEMELPPDTGAAMAWLKQRKPAIWNKEPARVDLTSGGKTLNAIDLSKLSTETLNELINASAGYTE